MNQKESAQKALAEFPDIDNQDMDFNGAVMWLVEYADVIKSGLSRLAEN